MHYPATKLAGGEDQEETDGRTSTAWSGERLPACHEFVMVPRAGSPEITTVPCAASLSFESGSNQISCFITAWEYTQ